MNQSLRHFWSSHLSSSITAPYRHSTNQILLSYLSFPTPSFSLCPLYCIVVFISVSIPRIRAFLCQPHFFSPVSPKQRNFYNTDMFSYRVSYTDLGTSLDSLKWVVFFVISALTILSLIILFCGWTNNWMREVYNRAFHNVCPQVSSLESLYVSLHIFLQESSHVPWH